MLKLTRIAITGGIASGKTSVCRVFQELGAFVVNADAIVHELLSPDTDLGQQIIRLLGKDILKDGKLSRRLIADIVFKDPEALHALEKLLHPAVLHKIEDLYITASREGKYSAFVVESPLLFETGQEKFYDIVIAVVADEPIMAERFEKAGFSREDFMRRMKRQWASADKAKSADYVIENKGSLDQLRRQAKDLYERLQNKTPSRGHLP
jgi:dephospho-CoA kinase